MTVTTGINTEKFSPNFHTKLTEAQRIISKATLDETGDCFLTRKLDKVRVVGMNEPVEIYELMETTETATDRQKETAFRFKQALTLFEKRDWKNASGAFRHVLDHENDDGPSKLYLKRCETFLNAPPSEDWDGVFILDTK